MTDQPYPASTWVGATAKEIARAVRRGDASATEVLAEHLEHLRAGEPLLRAFRALRAEAMAEADAVDELEHLGSLPLAGVPVAVKENTCVAGVPTWHGSAATRGPVADADHEVVRRLRGAGAVVVGITRMPELGVFSVTDDAEAVTRNPWRTDRSPGGSSGGAAAAVAAGFVPIAHGNDGFGSVRIPAACCGLVGVKPGRGVVPVELGVPDELGFVEHGILATTVADATLGLAALADWPSARLTEPRDLRVAVCARSPVPGIVADEPARAALRSAARLIVAVGHSTVGAGPAYPVSTGLTTLAIWLVGAHRSAAAHRFDLRRLQPRTRRHAWLGGWIDRQGLARASVVAAWRRRCEDWFAGGYDVLVTPALATTPPPALNWHARSWQANLVASVRYAPYGAPWNLAGFPAVVVPMGVRPDGLPVAVQLVGPPASELTLLGLAGQLEQASPWLRHAPGWPRVAAGWRAGAPAGA